MSCPQKIELTDGYVWEKLDIADMKAVRSLSRRLAEHEKGLPSWFVRLSKLAGGGTGRGTWEKFILRMDFVYVLKCKSTPVACVLFEKEDGDEKGESQGRSLHFAACQKISSDVLRPFLLVLRDHLFRAGFTYFSAWVCSHHIKIFKLLESLGFDYTGLKGLTGIIGKRPVEWELLNISKWSVVPSQS